MNSMSFVSGAAVAAACLCVWAGCASGDSVAAASAMKLLDPAKAAFTSGKAVDGGVEITLDLSDKRVNWNHARWSVHRFDKPVDLRGTDGLQLTVTTDNPRGDVGVYVALQEADGTWRHHPWAVSLTRKENIGTARFADFVVPLWVAPPGGSHGDENAVLDLDRISAIAIGSVNPLGVGPVTFTLRQVLAVQPLPQAPRQVAIRVSGQWLDVNGTTTIPAGVFGGFHGPRDPQHKLRMAMDRTIMSHFATNGDARFGRDAISHTLLNCAGERIWPSPVLHDPQWKDKTTALAAKMAQQAKAADRELWVEFWNEPYLNWAKAERANFIPRFFNLDEAAEGGQVKLKHSGEVVPHLRWTKDYNRPPWQWATPQEWRRGRDADGNVYSPVHAKPYHKGPGGLYGGWWDPSTHPPVDVKDGQTYTIQRGGKEITLTAFTPWHVYDETQFTYWSGRGMVKFYRDQMEAFGPTLKKALPTAKFYAGWGLRPSEDKWACFDMLYKPIIDAGHAYIDGLHGHDYGSGPLAENACAEAITAYGVTRHGKWLTWINTEQRGMIDLQAYPDAQKIEQPKLEKATWFCRKALHALSFVPDKVRGHCQFDFKADEEGLGFELLNRLRGRLLHVENPDGGIYAVASVDGTDPQNPRPAFMPDRREMVLALLNDNASARTLTLDVAAPAGAKLGKPVIRRLVKKGEAGTVVVDEAAFDAARPLELAPQEVVAIVWPLEGELAEAAPVQRRQFFASAIAAPVTHAKPVVETIKIDPAALKAARKATLRIVAENLEWGEAIAVVGNKTYPLPACVTPDNAAWIREIAIDPSQLSAETKVELRITSDAHAGFFLGCASLLVEGK